MAGIRTRPYQKEEICLTVSRDLLEKQYGSETEAVLRRLEAEKDPRILAACPFLRTDPADLAGYLVLRYLHRLSFQPRLKVWGRGLFLSGLPDPRLFEVGTAEAAGGNPLGRVPEI